MSEHLREPSPEEQGKPEDQTDAIYNLVNTLEGFARMYSEDYDDETEDGFRVERETTDLDGLFKSTVSFEVQRCRGSFGPDPLVPADVEMTEYIIKSSVRRQDIPYATLPPELYEYIDQFEDFDTDDYDEKTEVAVEYEQTYTISTDGELIFENFLTLYLDGEGVALPDDPGVLLPNSDEIEDVPEGFDEAFFETIFNDSEMDALMAVSREVEQEHRFNHPVYRFYELMEDTRYTSHKQRAELAESIVQYFFSQNYA